MKNHFLKWLFIITPVRNSEANTRRQLGVISRTLIENVLCGAAVIKSLAKAVKHYSLYTFRRQYLEMETKQLAYIYDSFLFFTYTYIKV